MQANLNLELIAGKDISRPLRRQKWESRTIEFAFEFVFELDFELDFELKTELEM